MLIVKFAIMTALHKLIMTTQIIRIFQFSYCVVFRNAVNNVYVIGTLSIMYNLKVFTGTSVDTKYPYVAQF